MSPGLRPASVKSYLHALRSPFSIRRRGGNVVGVCITAEADNFGKDGGIALLRLLQVFQHQDARAFRHHKTVTVLLKGSACFLRFIIARGQCLQGTETGHRQRRDGGLNAACYHGICVPALDDAECLANRVIARSAGRDHAAVGPAASKVDRDLAGSKVYYQHGNKEW